MKLLISFLHEHYVILLRQAQSLIWNRAPRQWQIGEKGVIILLPGIFNSWNFFKTIGDFLSKEGYKVFLIKGLERNLVTFEAAQSIIESFLQENNLEDVNMIGYSKGGLIAQYFLENSLVSNRVKKLITIATPFAGSYVAYAMIPFNGLEFVPGASVIKTLRMQKQAIHKITNLYSLGDNLVIPNKSLHLDGGENIQIPVWGHTNILEAKETREVIKKILEG